MATRSTSASGTEGMTEAELAEYYDRTHDLSEFEGGETIPVTPGPRDVVMSVRFTADESTRLRERADQAGMKVTAFIRAAALGAEHPVDVAQLREELTTIAGVTSRVFERLGGGGLDERASRR